MKNIDRQMIDLCDIINSFPGVKTSFSCSGHGKNEFYIVMDFTNAKSIQQIAKAFTVDETDDICYMMKLSSKEKADIIKKMDNIYHYMYRCEMMPLYVDYGEDRKIKMRFRVGNIGLGLMKCKRRKKEINRIISRLVDCLYEMN